MRAGTIYRAVAVAIFLGLIAVSIRGCSDILPPAGPTITNLFPTIVPTITPTTGPQTPVVTQTVQTTAAFNNVDTIQVINPNGGIAVGIGANVTNVVINAIKSTPGLPGTAANTRLDNIVITAERFPINSNTLQIQAIIPVGTGIYTERVDFVITIPAGADLNLTTQNGDIVVNINTGVIIARTANGAIRITDNIGNVNVATANGDLTLTNIVGDVTGTTSNASMDVTARISVGGTITLTNNNGPITLQVPTSTSADMTLTANNGAVSANLNGFFTSGLQQPSAGVLSVTLNNGNGQIFASTSNADITFAGTNAIP